MNVVGRVGSFISQGVYSVATPFHPFGGAVDIIVVQQQDGTFRSTPWYVRFGKFQGVLKGAEKIVRINVNGIEADFHMYLDNSGEAYFIREAGPSKGSKTDVVMDDPDSHKAVRGDSVSEYPNAGENPTYKISRLESSLSDSAVIELQNECASPGPDQLDRADSDVGRKFYEFQDEQSSYEGSVELSEYESNRYDNLESVENLVESQDSDSEVILFSVDGHVLTAPLSSSEENTENVKLCTPQFHLGPGKGTDICEGNEDFSTSEDPWAANYIDELDMSTCNTSSENVYNDTNAIGHQSEICEGECVCPSQETQGATNPETDMHNNLEDASSSIQREDVFKSCLELSELATHSGFSASNSDSPRNRYMSQELHIENDSTDKISQGAKHMGLESVSAHSVRYDLEWKDDQCGMSQEGANGSPHKHPPEDGCCKSEIVEPQAATSSEGVQTDTSIGFEISLCGNKLCAGMGLRAASEAFDAHRISAEEFKLSAVSVIKNEDLIIRYRERYMRWDKAAPIVLGVAAFGLDLPVEAKDTIPVDEVDDGHNSVDDIADMPTPSSGRRWRLWPIPFRRVKTLEHSNSHSSNEEVFVDSEPSSQNSLIEPTTMPQSCRDSPRKQLIKTHNPTTEQIASLNLREGQNIITFSFSTRVLGKQQVDAHIYLWMWNTRIVISDVDGTITKSDVLGQFMPLVGRDWSQFGVAQLFSAIKENGYQLLFLSARAIVQAYLTRSFLLNLKQDGKALPNGPVVISPDGLFPSLYREVVRRAPHEFKIACLEDIKALFPADYNPFYAGFGNRDTDELSYRKIGIPKGKIFIINPKGEVAINHRVHVKSYTSLHTLVNDMFPPTSMVEQEDYNSWNFWRLPLPDIDL